MHNIKTGLQQRISLKVFFVENPRFENLDKMDTFLSVFLQRGEIYSLKLKSLSITDPNDFCFKLSQVFS